MNAEPKVTVFLVCYNESELLPHTISHYRRLIPSSKFVIYDNMSTDSSRKIAESLGCRVMDFHTENIIDDFKLRDLKNECWSGYEDDWVIVCDMDEWLCIDAEDLTREDKENNTIVDTLGFDIVGSSQQTDISDINPHSLSKGVRNKHLDKKVCFKPQKISKINYDVGAHICRPEGDVKTGGRYLLKHMNWLGFPYHQARNKIRVQRSEKMRSMGLAIHYREDDKMWSSYFQKLQEFSIDLKSRCDCFVD